MIRKLNVIFCENEHGAGDVTFPDLLATSGWGLEQQFIEGNTVGGLRKAAKEKGWGRVNGADFCPGCMESM